MSGLGDLSSSRKDPPNKPRHPTARSRRIEFNLASRLGCSLALVIKMTKVTKNLPPKFQVWVDARKLFHLSHVHIQMARELGMNPKKFGSLANHDQERWKTPLPGFIEDLFFKRFGKERPDEVLSIEDLFKKRRNKTTEREAKGQGEIRDSEADEDSECPF